MKFKFYPLLIVLALVLGCGNTILPQDPIQEPDLEVDRAVSSALVSSAQVPSPLGSPAGTRLRTMLSELAGAIRYPRSLTVSGTPLLVGPKDWTSGFFPGMLWHMYGSTKDPFWKQNAELYTNGLRGLTGFADTHDLSFMMERSFGTGFRATGNSTYRDILVASAKTLSKRYNSRVGAVRSWGPISDKKNFIVIVDSLMTTELLFDASKLSGDRNLYNQAVAHARTVLKNHLRPDGGTFHVVTFNPATGKVRARRTHAGYSDSSTWARGEAWALYGFTATYIATGDAAFLNAAKRVAEYILSPGRLPADFVTYWDFNAPRTTNTPRDSAAAAIMASAFLDLSKRVEPERASRYFKAAEAILQNLSSASYTKPEASSHGFVLAHGTGNFPAGSEIDTSLVYADYYYLEALQRYQAMTAAQ